MVRLFYCVSSEMQPSFLKTTSNHELPLKGCGTVSFQTDWWVNKSGRDVAENSWKTKGKMASVRDLINASVYSPASWTEKQLCWGNTAPKQPLQMLKHTHLKDVRNRTWRVVFALSSARSCSVVKRRRAAETSCCLTAICVSLAKKWMEREATLYLRFNANCMCISKNILDLFWQIFVVVVLRTRLRFCREIERWSYGSAICKRRLFHPRKLLGGLELQSNPSAWAFSMLFLYMRVAGPDQAKHYHRHREIGRLACTNALLLR